MSTHGSGLCSGASALLLFCVVLYYPYYARAVRCYFLLALASECFMKDIIFSCTVYAEEEKPFISVHYMWASSSAFSPVTMVTGVFDYMCVCML